MLIPVRALYIHDRFHPNHHDNDLALLELSRPLTFSPSLIHLCLPTKDFSENILMHSGRMGITERQGVSRTQKLVYMTLDECRRQLNVSHPLSNKMFCMRRETAAAGRQIRPLVNQNRVQRSTNGPSGYRNVAQERLNGQTGNQNQNPAHNYENEEPGTETGAGKSDSSKIQNHETSEADGSLRSEVSGRQCGGLLPGTPVATVDRETAFLTGLLMSSSAGCDGGGLVFTKLSRYLGWIKPRVETAEDHMTPQVTQYPENR